MYFAYPLPWWGALLLVLIAGLVGFLSYRGLTPRPRGTDQSALGRPGRALALLGVLRAVTVLILLLVLFRPLLGGGTRNPDPRLVPVLVDQSRSMRIADADGRRRIDDARERLRPLLAQLGKQFRPEVFGFGSVVAPSDLDHVATADQPATDIEGALNAVRGRYQGRNVAGILVVSDGAETEAPVATSGGQAPAAVRTDSGVAGPPVFTLGVGGSGPDREVRGVTANRQPLAASMVELDAVVSSRGLGNEPFDLRLVAHGAASVAASDGRVADVRRVTPVDGAPVHVIFSVPAEASPALYTVEVPPDSREAVVDNNRAAVIVAPPPRKRRVLFVQGAPGFEHSFLKRAWSADPAVEVDSVVRKGKNDQGVDAYFIQADPGRAPALIGGYPTTKAGLFVYDAIVFASVEWDFLTREQMAMTADFVRERGGGVLVLGARSFAASGLAGTPLDAALPLERAAGKSAVALTSNSSENDAGPSGSMHATNGEPRTPSGEDNRVRLTALGRDDAITRVALTPADNSREWASLPPLAAVNQVGPPRPGASVLAVASVSGSTRAVLAVQRYGRGRTAEFTGEGSWRWKMLMPATDRTHELFWRQALRWLSATAPDPVSIAPTDGTQPGTAAQVDVLVADGEFQPIANARVNVRLTAPGGELRTATATLADAATGRYSARLAVPASGVYHVEADARRGAEALGTADQWFVAGAKDPETSDPRLNEQVLQRIASSTHGQFLSASDLAQLPALLSQTPAANTVTSQPRDIWQHPLVFALLVALLGAEWTLRRRWGFA